MPTMQRDNPIPDIASVAKDMQEQPTKNKKWVSTYAVVMKKINDLDTDKRLTPEELRIVKLERNAAQLPIRIGEHRSTVNQTLATVTNNMKLLKESKNKIATEMYKNYEQPVAGIQPVATSLLEARSKLEEEVSSFTGEKTQRVTEIKQAMEQGKPLSMIKGMIDQTEKKGSQLENKFTDINKKEDDVKHKLETLKRETTATLVTTGTSVHPVMPEPTTPTKGGPGSA